MNDEDTETIGITGAIGLCLLVALLALTGCSTKPTVSAEDTIKAGLMDGAIAAAKAPLFKLTCPATGCILGSLEVGNPAGAAQMAEVVRVAMAPQPSEASQNYRATLQFFAPMAGNAVIGHFASNIVGKVVSGFESGFASNTAIADSGFDANVKGFDALKEALLKPSAQPTVTNFTFGDNATVGDGNTRTIQNWTNSYNRNAVGGNSGTTGPGGGANNGP